MLAAIALAAAVNIIPPHASQAAMLRQLADAIEAPLDPLEKRVEEARVAGREKRVLDWGKAVMPEKFPLPFCAEMHGYFVDIRHAELSSVVAPRGHAKSTVKITLIELFQMLEEPEIYDYYLNIQATTPKAAAINCTIKHELENNEVIRALYGDLVGVEKWTDLLFVLKTGVVVQAAGAGQSIRGLQYNNRRPKYVNVDDLYDEDDIEHTDQIDKKNRWFWGSLYPTRAKGVRTAFHAQGTAIGQNDILFKLAQEPGVVHKEFSAYDPKTRKVLWPELNTIEQLEKERERMGSAIFDREMQGLRRNAADAIIKEHWLDGWEYDSAIKWANIVRDYGPGSAIRILGAEMGVDPSTGEKEQGDPQGFALGIVTAGPGSRKDLWLEMLCEENLSFDARLAKLEAMAAQHRGRYPDPAFLLRRAKIEAIAGFLDFGNAAKKKTGLPVELVTWVKGKKANLAAKSGHFEFGRVHVSTSIPKPLREKLKDQLLVNEPPHDDLRDAVLLLLEDPTMPAMKSWV